MSDRRKLLITGGSSGIGAATAQLAATRGYDVTLGYGRDAEGAEATLRAVEEAGGSGIAVRADLADPEAVIALFEEHDRRLGALDAFVNNAGIVAEAARTEDLSAERISRIFEVNVIGAILAAGYAVRRMAHRYGGSGGVIVNVSSAAARHGSAGEYVDYAASKAAIDTFTKGLAEENATEGIRVVGIRPGIIDTPIHGKGGDPGRADRIAATVPMRRKGTALECAEAILRLLSDAAGYTTGTMLDVAGGR